MSTTAPDRTRTRAAATIWNLGWTGVNAQLIFPSRYLPTAAVRIGQLCNTQGNWKDLATLRTAQRRPVDLGGHARIQEEAVPAVLARMRSGTFGTGQRQAWLLAHH